MIRQIFIFLIITRVGIAQPDLKFDSFDWVQYRQAGKINSITFGDRFAYIGTQSGGIMRFNVFANRFEESITMAQGLHSNTITAIHRSSNGMLWVATPIGIEFSFNEVGNWRFIDRNEISFDSRTFIERIGESKNSIWLGTSGLVYRLDPVTGVLTGVMPNPDETVIWSSGLLQLRTNLSDILIDFTLMDGWITDLQSLIHPNGQYINITTITKNAFNEVWIGTEDGTIFRGDNTMKTFTPYRFSLASNDIWAIGGDDSFWLGGQLANFQPGISYLDIDRGVTDIYLFDNIINMDETSVFSILELKEEIWFGGENTILVYNKKKNYWRTYNFQIDGKKSWVTSMVEVGENMWLGGPHGIYVLRKSDKKIIDSEVNSFFKDVFIYDLALGDKQIWIGTETGIFLYDVENDLILNYTSYGYTESDVIFPGNTTDFTAFVKNKYQIFAASRLGILSFNFKDRQWSNAVNPSIFGGLEIKTMALDNNIIFIATTNNLVQYDMEKNLMDVYNYSFIGQVNDMYIKDRRIWLGTTEGLISYQYK